LSIFSRYAGKNIYFRKILITLSGRTLFYNSKSGDSEVKGPTEDDTTSPYTIVPTPMPREAPFLP
jgi:hypothetical protein